MTLRADARRNREQIIVAARGVFAERGFDVPMDEIARAAKVGVGTLYRRFPDRDALMRAVATDSLTRVLDEARRAAAEEPSAWQALVRFRGDGSPRAFVLRIAHNRGLSHAFRRAKEPRAPAQGVEPADPRPPADERLAAGERAEQFLRHLRTLPLGQREVVALALEGLQHAEIAAIVGITPENVAVRLGRARAALRRSIEKEEAA